MKKFLILACSALFFATSCLSGDNNPGESSAKYVGTITTTDLSTGEKKVIEGAVIRVTFPNISESKMNIVFYDMKFATMMPKIDIEVENIPFLVTQVPEEASLNFNFDVKNVVPKSGGISYESFMMSRLWGDIGRIVKITFVVPSREMEVFFTTETKTNTETTSEN